MKLTAGQIETALTALEFLYKDGKMCITVDELMKREIKEAYKTLWELANGMEGSTAEYIRESEDFGHGNIENTVN